jgi:hypothetical protein
VRRLLTLYCKPFIPRSFSRPAKRALPILVLNNRQHSCTVVSLEPPWLVSFHDNDETYRSRKLNRYSNARNGISRTSIFLSSRFVAFVSKET